MILSSCHNRFWAGRQKGGDRGTENSTAIIRIERVKCSVFRQKALRAASSTILAKSNTQNLHSKRRGRVVLGKSRFEWKMVLKKFKTYEKFTQDTYTANSSLFPLPPPIHSFLRTH